jgi:CRISPR-associated protein Cmr6
LLDRAFQHAFEWVGFGAKTSVGYGAMTPKAAKAAQSGASQGPVGAANSATPETWPSAVLTLNPGTGEIKASFAGQSTAGLKGPAADQLRAALGEERANKLKKNKELKGVSVEIEKQGNALLLKGLSSA